MIKSLELQERWVDVFESELTTLLYKEITGHEHFSDDKSEVDTASEALQDIFLTLQKRVVGKSCHIKYDNLTVISSLLMAFFTSIESEGVVVIKDMIRIMFLDETTILIYSNDDGD